MQHGASALGDSLIGLKLLFGNTRTSVSIIIDEKLTYKKTVERRLKYLFYPLAYIIKYSNVSDVNYFQLFLLELHPVLLTSAFSLNRKI